MRDDLIEADKPPQPMCRSLSVSVVCYAPSLRELDDTLETLGKSVLFARQQGVLSEVVLFLIDNGPGDGWGDRLRPLVNSLEREQRFSRLELLTGQGNVGYGSGHNLAIWRSKADFHLILNPDVVLERDAVYGALCFLATHSDIAMIGPYVDNEAGVQQFLCKRYPSVFDLFLRGFFPKISRLFFSERLDVYEMSDVCRGEEPVYDVPIIGGCFMFVRRKILQEVGGFSSRYFMYFEDFDLSIKLGELSRSAYVPYVRIKHLGGGAARKGWRHVFMFVRSALVFYNSHGWKFW